jgi:hypothetical protein
MFGRSIAYYKGIFLDPILTCWLNAESITSTRYKNFPDGFPKPSALG